MRLQRFLGIISYAIYSKYQSQLDFTFLPFYLLMGIYGRSGQVSVAICGDKRNILQSDAISYNMKYRINRGDFTFFEVKYRRLDF